MFEEKFIFTGAAKKSIFITLGVGLLLLILGCIFVASSDMAHGHGTAHHTVATDEAHADKLHPAESHGVDAAHHEDAKPVWVVRLIKNIWHNNIFFTGISLIGVFFVAFNYVAWAGWGATVKRIPEAFGNFLPIAGVLTLVSFILFNHDLFHWTHGYLYDQTSELYDPLIAGKAGYLNIPFFLFRMVAYFVLWYFSWLYLRKYSLQEDITGSIIWYDKSVVLSAIFLVIFGITSSTAAWDWVMSIDPHFFSTMYGWYVFASWFVTGLAVLTLIVLFLKDNGYLKIVNENHIHDLGKFMFAFSVFWTYIWFAQFLLIWYANIPEESVYFVQRLKNDTYSPIFFMNLFINFLFPFLILMTREAKRQSIILKVVACAIIFGHWFDFYIMLTPPVLKNAGGLDVWMFFMELGMFLVYASGFLFVVLSGLASANLIPKNHPMLQESVHHHVY